MGKKPNNSAALKEQKVANAQSQKNFEAQMKMMAKQMEAAEVPAFSIPVTEKTPPPPTQSNMDVAAAGKEQRISARRRYGFQQSVSANLAPMAAPALGTTTAL